MNVTDPDLVIVRGINDVWFKENFSKMWIGFGGSPKGVPKQDANYVALYIGAPVSSIAYIGVVSQINRFTVGADFYLRALIKLPVVVNTNHQIRKHEYWKITDFGLSPQQIKMITDLVSF